MSKIKAKFNVKDIVLVIIVLMLFIVNLIIMLKKVNNKTENENNLSKNNNIVYENKATSQKETPQTNDEIIRYLSTLNERDRIQYYCGQFFKYINHSDYQSAYNLLYADFKTNYFQTMEDFEKYALEFYPKFFALDYDDISRQGNIYVLRVKVIDIENPNQQENFQRIVIRENDYNNFELSFQVIQSSNTNITEEVE